jgi:alpha-methylacyl-CoA racemase
MAAAGQEESANDTGEGCEPGSLAGVRVVEFPAIGPVPFAGMVLADLGAEVVRIDRVQPTGLGIAMPPRFNLLNRGKRSIAVDLKHPDGIAVARRLVAASHILLEGFRPGVMERLGLGPEACLAANPALIYGRISGWGERGPLAGVAGHDINYLGLSGALAAMGEPGAPPPVPLNLIGDFGGGSMFLVAGVLAALLHARRSGIGQVVRTSIAEAALALMPMFYGLRAAGLWTDRRGDNVLDGGAPFYRTYATRDGRFVAVGAIEPKFYAALVAGLGLAGRVALGAQLDRKLWPETTALFAARFREKTRAEWSEVFADSDACVTPVLEMDEAATHPQHAALGSFVASDGMRAPAPAPEFTATPRRAAAPPPGPGADTASVLAALGYSAAEIARLVALFDTADHRQPGS